MAGVFMYKKVLTIGALILVFCIWFGVSAVNAQTSETELAYEQIDQFDSDITVHSDGTFRVKETITYNFGSTSHHGISRNIRYKYKRSGANYNIRLEVISVTNGSGQERQYTTSKWNGQFEIKIGNPESYVTGIQVYEITYDVKRALNYFDAYDELYWNATGTEWPVGINQTYVTVHLPEAVNFDAAKLACYTGSYGSQDSDCYIEVVDDTTILFSNEYFFEANEGISILLGMPHGVVTKPPFSQRLMWFLGDNWAVLIPFVFLGIMFFLWYTRGRDPKVRDTLVPQYEPPDKMAVGVLGTVVDEKVDLKDISATIIQLAIKGYLKVKEIKTKNDSKEPDDYDLIKLKEPDANLHKYEIELMDGIFGSGSSKTVSKLKNKFYTHLPAIKKAMYDLVVTEGYFPTNPDKVRNGYTIIAFLIIPFGVFLAIGFQNIIAGIVTVIAGVGAIFFARVMPRKTKKGADAHVTIEGFKWFLSVTEKERLKFHNAPAKSPKEFEEFLPYAMVLGVEKEWADQFKDMYITPPEWYEGHHMSAFGALYLTNALGSMTTSTNSAIVSRPSSAAGGGSSGFSSGGGFSGGGFGGGGGGSW